MRWISDALVRAAETGGLNLFRDLYLPLLMTDNWLRENRSSFLIPNPDYTPLEPDSGHFKLLSEAGRGSDWNLPYEQLTIPTLVITGLQDHVFFEPDVVDALFDRLPQGKRIDMPDAFAPFEQIDVEIGHATCPDLPFLDESRHLTPGILDGCACPIGPVELVQVDPFHPESVQ